MSSQYRISNLKGLEARGWNLILGGVSWDCKCPAPRPMRKPNLFLMANTLQAASGNFKIFEWEWSSARLLRPYCPLDCPQNYALWVNANCNTYNQNFSPAAGLFRCGATEKPLEIVKFSKKRVYFWKKGPNFFFACSGLFFETLVERFNEIGQTKDVGVKNILYPP